MLVKRSVEIAQKRRQCRVCEKQIHIGQKFYMTRWDWEPPTRKRVTCCKCVSEFSEPLFVLTNSLDKAERV